MNKRFDSITRQLESGNPRERLSALFCETLGWGTPHGRSPRTLELGGPINRTVTAHPVAELSGVPVFRIDWHARTLPGITARRAVQRALKSTHAEHIVCYITSDQQQLAFVWARRRPDGRIELRTLPYEVGSPARTTIEQLGKLAFDVDELGPSGTPSITAVTDKLNAAFSVEAVTNAFFEDYKTVFADLQQRLVEATGDTVWAHDYALQLLNRLMFLYFIQRKRWLGDDPRFMATFWRAYTTSGQQADTFHERWLSLLFFEAFNNSFHGGHRHFPETIRAALQEAPYLNGGLFSKNQLDRAKSINLPDEFFATLFDRFNGSSPGFLERYNFTIAESTPLDLEVAVDPEMIGKVYESLVNITFEGLTEQDQRGTAGIFYTPRAEIDLMCRLSLVDALANRLGDQIKPMLYEAVIAADPAEKELADARLAERNLWPELSAALRELTVCDPACGSGSFLVGMLLVLDDLQARAATQLGIEETPYERRRRIVGEQLYGVDVMDWAVHVAELRLWLQLVVETELEAPERKLRPLLPNLTFKIRCGDSLVQEVGGINFNLHRSHLDIPPPLKGRITQLKGKKRIFYQGKSTLGEADLKAEELVIFRDILAAKRIELEKAIAKHARQIESPPEQIELAGIATGSASHDRLKREEELRAERAELHAELDRIKAALDALGTTQTVPFVWDIAFVEIFEGDSGGFDIVIGNPPYVRQEMIAPPGINPTDVGGEHSERWKELKKAYKAKLQESVAAAWPRFFRYKPGSTTFRKPDGKSDLYIYFYFHGLSLLNPRGTFCFITSNSWLDVGYGADLQEFLLRHSHIKFILDNERKRSFAQADVNTIIALLAPPDDRREGGLDNTARFVMFTAPFEEVATAETFKTLEETTERCSTDRWRISVRSQRELLEEGLARDEDEESSEPSTPRKSRGPLIKTARYIANKWGGKYLRAPEIFFTILEKGKGKLVRLGDIAEVRFGIKTGANEFFYLDEETIRHWGIEEEFLKPVIKSPRECRSIVIKPEDLKFKIFMCHKDKAELKGTAALEYIKWGESQGFHVRPSCRGRQRWWELDYEIGEFLWWKSIGERYCFFWNIERFPTDQRNYYLNLKVTDYKPKSLVLSLNSTIDRLFIEANAREMTGAYTIIEMPVVDVVRKQFLYFDLEYFDATSFLTRPVVSIQKEIHQPDRRALDDVVFDVLGLTAGEREAVYEAVISLVRARLEKARSI
jgi:type I restriction-modification system DNA methylase subunit